MDKKKHDRLKSLLKRDALHSPSRDFTSVVMDEIQARSESVASPALASLLKVAAGKGPSDVFTVKVIAQLDRSQARKLHRPVISSRFWLAAAVIFIGGFTWIALQPAPANAQGLTPIMLKLGGLVSELLSQAGEGTVMFIATAVAGCVLMLLDYLLKRSKSGELQE